LVAICTLLDTSTAQTTFYAMYQVFDPVDTGCLGYSLKVYTTDVKAAQSDGKDRSITSSQCYKSAAGSYVKLTCDSISKIQSSSIYASAGCSGSPTSVTTRQPVNCNYNDSPMTYQSCLKSYCIQTSPPIMFMGCTINASEASSRGFKDAYPSVVSDLSALTSTQPQIPF
jgi:hypothetical protein